MNTPRWARYSWWHHSTFCYSNVQCCSWQCYYTIWGINRTQAVMWLRLHLGGWAATSPCYCCIRRGESHAFSIILEQCCHEGFLHPWATFCNAFWQHCNVFLSPSFMHTDDVCHSRLCCAYLNLVVQQQESWLAFLLLIFAFAALLRRRALTCKLLIETKLFLTKTQR